MDDVAEACRFAALEFVDGVRNGWGKRELAKWLLGPYHQISMLRLTKDELHRRAALFPRAKVNESVRNEHVAHVMLTAREDVLRVIDGFEAGYPNAESFIWRLQSRGLFARVEDSTGARGMVPNEVAPQRLAERVISLIAVDYIARPFDYEDRAAVCRVCGTVTFTPEARKTHDCGRHRNSGVQVRADYAEMDFTDADVEQADVHHLIRRV